MKEPVEYETTWKKAKKEISGGTLTSSKNKKIENNGFSLTTSNIKRMILKFRLFPKIKRVSGQVRLVNCIDLELSHVNFDHNYILVVNGKGSKDRTVPLAPRLKKMLFKYAIAYRKFVNIIVQSAVLGGKVQIFLGYRNIGMPQIDTQAFQITALHDISCRKSMTEQMGISYYLTLK